MAGKKAPNRFKIRNIFQTKGKTSKPKRTPGEKKLAAAMGALDPSTPAGLKKLFNK